MTVADLLAIAAIVFAAFVARGITGFGSATLALPTLAQVIGVVVIAFGLRALGSSQAQHRVSRAWVVPAGLAGGTLGGLFGSGAATPFMIYLTHRLSDRTRVRASFSAFALSDCGLRLLVFALGGLCFPLFRPRRQVSAFPRWLRARSSAIGCAGASATPGKEGDCLAARSCRHPASCKSEHVDDIAASFPERSKRCVKFTIDASANKTQN